MKFDPNDKDIKPVKERNPDGTPKIDTTIEKEKTNQEETANTKNDELTAVLAVYNQLHGKSENTVKQLWKVIFGLIVIVSLCVAGMVYVGSLSKVDLAVIHTNGNNEILSINTASRLDHTTMYPEVSTYLIEQFVKNSRAVVLDGVYEKSLMRDAFAVTQGQASKALNAFYVERNPKILAEEKLISVEINSIIPNVGGSNKTTQVTWTETTRTTMSNEIIDTEKYTGQFTFVLTKSPPTDTEIMKRNPLGFYIQHISWSRNFKA